MISKALKPWSKDKPSLSDRKDAIGYVARKFKEYVYYPVTGFFRRTYERVSRSLAFARLGYLNYDFDHSYLYSVMSFKLKRIHANLIDGYAIQHGEDMDALKEAIKICDRLFNDQYDDKYYREHDKKWGKLRSKHIPEYDENGKIKHYRWESWRAKANTPAKKKREVADLRKIWEYEVRDRHADLDRLNEILKKHGPTWWD